MKQNILTGLEKIETRQIDKPEAKAGEVRIRVVRMGICGSDIHAYHGKHPSVHPPVVLGHEFAGVVDQLGEGVTGFEIGQKVTVRPQRECGECLYCRTGHANVCTQLQVIGCTCDGGGQEYFCAPAKLVIPLADSITFDMGAMAEPVAVTVGNIRALSKIEGQDILVLGAGTIGNLTAQTAKALGARKVAITDVMDGKLEMAKRCGIEYTINTRTQNLQEEVTRIFGEYGPDAILECVGIGTTLNQAIEVSRKCAEIIVVGVYSEPPRVNVLPIQEKQLRVIGVLMYTEENFREAVRMMGEGKYQLEPLMTRHFPMEQNNEAYDFISANPNDCMKVLVDVTDAQNG